MRVIKPGASLLLLILFGVVALAQQAAQQPAQKQGEVPLQFRPAYEKAPHTDDYYLATPEGDRVPDEFFVFRRLNQMKTSEMEGYHLPPILIEMSVLNLNRKVKPGDEVKFSAILTDPTEVGPFSLGFDGPTGRRTDPGWTSARFTRAGESKTGNQVFEGVLKVNKWAQAGRYLPKFAIPSNRLGHTKGYFADWHPELKEIWFEVDANPNEDIEGPRIRSLELTPNRIEITDHIAITATVDDNLSGVDSVVATIVSPSNKYIDVPLVKSFNDPKTYRAHFRLNPWYEEGEYIVKKAYINDNADNFRYYFETSDTFLQKARFVLTRNDRADVTSPELITLSFDKDVAKPAEEIKVKAIVADDRSGIEHLTVFFISPNLLDKRRVQLRPTAKPPIMIKPAFDVQLNTFEGVLKIDPLDETGDWTVTRVVATDYANNYLNVPVEESKELQSLKVTFSKTGNAPGRPSTSGPNASAPAAQPASGATAGKIRRVDMVPPHPPRGACLNCHEPQ